MFMIMIMIMFGALLLSVCTPIHKWSSLLKLKNKKLSCRTEARRSTSLEFRQVT